MGEFEHGLELIRRAQRLNPLHPSWYHFSVARLHFSRWTYRETIADAQHIELPHFYWTHRLVSVALGQLGSAEAAAASDRVFEIKPDFPARAKLRKWNAAPGDPEHFMSGLKTDSLRE